MPEYRMANGFPMIRTLYEKKDEIMGYSHIIQNPLF